MQKLVTLICSFQLVTASRLYTYITILYYYIHMTLSFSEDYTSCQFNLLLLVSREQCPPFVHKAAA